MNVPLEIESVATDVVSASGAQAGRVDLAEMGGSERKLSIVMGRTEARAIDEALDGKAPPRPLAWDLLRSVIEVLGGTLGSVVITDVEEGRLFRAEIVLNRADEEYRVPARPSDALALAVRCACPHLFATAEVMDRAATS